MTFDDAFTYVVGEEGVLSLDPQDRGNWTGGKVGVGELKGTKYGISAAAFPTLDIANLTLYQARALGKTIYWDAFFGDQLPYPIALCIFDFGYNAGDSESVRVAQRCAGVQADGHMGPLTIAALKATPLEPWIREFAAGRIAAYQQMAGWAHNGRGWTARANRTMQVALQ